MRAHIIGDNPRELLGNSNNTDRLVAIDVESTGTEWEHRVIGVAISWREPESNALKSCYLSRAEDTQLGLFLANAETIDSSMLLDDICNRHIIVGHNWPFDYRMLMRWVGLSPIKRSIDTMHLAKCTGWHSRLALLDLFSKLVEKPNPWVLEMKKRRKTLHKLEPETAAKYAAGELGDSEMTLRLAETLLPKYKSIVGEEMAEIDMAFSCLVMQMVYRGVPLDKQWCSNKKKLFRANMAKLQTEYAKRGVRNLGSSQQVAGYLFSTLGLTPKSHTPTGKPSTKKADLEELAKEHPNLEGLSGIVAFNEYQKAISSWLDPMLEMSEWDGAIHSQLNPFGTRTFRMSSSSFNMQGIPLKKRGNRAYGGLHGAFKDPNPDYEIWQLDISQAEVRLAAMVAAENNLAKTLSLGTDPYIAQAIEMWADETRRQNAKSAVLSSIYATGKAAFAENNGISIELAGEILGAFRHKFPNISAATAYWEDYVFNRGYVPVPIYDKRRRIYLDKNAPDLYKAYNNIVQCSVAELMQKSMLITDEIDPNCLLLQIHDSLVVRVHRNQVEGGILDDISAAISNAVPEWVRARTDPQIPILVEAERFDQ